MLRSWKAELDTVIESGCFSISDKFWFGKFSWNFEKLNFVDKIQQRLKTDEFIKNYYSLAITYVSLFFKKKNNINSGVRKAITFLDCRVFLFTIKYFFFFHSCFKFIYSIFFHFIFRMGFLASYVVCTREWKIKKKKISHQKLFSRVLLPSD